MSLLFNSRISMLASCLLVIAHPDDESMFFSPTMLALQRHGLRVHVLCMSTGDADGLGAIRSQELHHSCQLLGVRKEDVIIIDDAELQDGMDLAWPAAQVASHVATAVGAIQPVSLLTFDQGGVSGHPNHQAVQRGVAFFQQCHSSRTTQPAGAVEVYQLETASVLLKYHPVLALLAALIRAALGHRLHIHINWRPWQAWRALRAHHSQMVWYRKLWMFCSSYMYLNTLRRAQLS